VKESEQVRELELVPLGVVTLTATLPGLPDGEVAVISVSDTTFTLVAGALPKSTAVAPLRFVPVIVTEVPPVVGPEDGVTSATAGAGGTNERITMSLEVCPTASQALAEVHDTPLSWVTPEGSDSAVQLVPL
jgi:hypothetical protein